MMPPFIPEGTFLGNTCFHARILTPLIAFCELVFSPKVRILKMYEKKSVLSINIEIDGERIEPRVSFCDTL